ncbi:hypothetical protein [Spirosoma aerolatum]|uniref:hypothetical protein n=1 Tax=Spirosoma aerolatum TaxID=1211326 RepID=UPI0009AEA963|nr:hypothetical protein [Spirosoma aerolatum]
MATTFDATFFDSLSDNVLKSLFLMANLMAAPEVEHLTKAGREVLGLNTYQMQDFFSEINEAMERRYGDVPGY